MREKPNLSKVHLDSEDLLAVTSIETALLLGKSVFVVVMLDYFFYQSLLALLPLSLVGIIYFRIEKQELIRKKRTQAREQFKELMLLVATGQKAGYSAENAFLSSYRDLKNLFGGDSSICKMLRVLKVGRENNIDFATLWKQIGTHINIQEIQEFAEIYEISYRSSGNMAEVMEKTAGIIVQKMETEKEIEVLLSARKMEQKIMNTMPFFIIFYISITSRGYFRGLYHTILGVIVMTLCMFLYFGAYALSYKITSIDV